MLPPFETPEEKVDAAGTYYIFEAIEENGEQQLAEIEDEELLEKLAAQFESRFDELYEDDDDLDDEGDDFGSDDE